MIPGRVEMNSSTLRSVQALSGIHQSSCSVGPWGLFIRR